MLELAERVEALAGADRDMDREIWLNVVADDDQRWLARVGLELHGESEAAFRLDRMMDGLAYTASLDAAMTLDCPELRQFGGPLALLREAMERLFTAKALDDALPRFLAAAFLRALNQVRAIL